MTSVFKRARAAAKRQGLRYMLRKGFTKFMWRELPGMTAQLAARKLNRLASVAKTVDQIVDLTMSFSYWDMSIAPMQVREEAIRLLSVVSENRPKTVLEIGTARGGTLFMFPRVSDPAGVIITVDLPGDEFGTGYPTHMAKLFRRFATGSQRVILVRGDSHKTETLDTVKNEMRGADADFLFIDGDHRYEGVKRDFEMYSPLVRKGGIVAFHDICAGPPENVGEVPRFWAEIRDKYRTETVIKDPSQGGFGVGIIHI